MIEERAKLVQLRKEVERGQRSEFPLDSRWVFAKKLRDRLLQEEFEVPRKKEDSATIKAAESHLKQVRQEMPLREQAEDIRARIEARARGDSRAVRSIIHDRANRKPVTRLGMRMTLEGKSEREIINLGMMAGTDDGEEDGTVSIGYLLIKQDEFGNPVENQLIKAKIFKGGKFFIRKDADYYGEQHRKSKGYSVVYPRPDRPEFFGEMKVLDSGQATKFLSMLEFLVDRCLTQPKSSFYRQTGYNRRALLK